MTALLSNLTPEYACFQAQGKLDEAAASYKQALTCKPDDPDAFMSLGLIYMKKKDYLGAKDNYEKALEFSEDRFPVLRVLLTVYDSLKDYYRLVEIYEECFNLVPELADDKKVVKAYKKACRKAGIQATEK